MARLVYSEHYYNCEVDDIQVYFEYKNSVVFSTNKKTRALHGGFPVKCKLIKVISKCEIEDYAGIYEVNRKTRGDHLVIQGIISFFSGVPLTVYHADKSVCGNERIKYKKRKTKLKIGKIDCSNDLEILLKRLEEESELIISVLDRWRKAIYLVNESQDADLFYDEAILSFFHIIEVFAEKSQGEIKSKLQNNIDEMLFKYYKDCYLENAKIKQMVDNSKKAVYSLLIGDSLNLAVKAKYFLEKCDLLDNNSANFIDDMIKVRNAIAHGRISFQKVFMWPLSPFYNLSKDSYDKTDFLTFLTARMISKYIGINCWEDEWNEVKKHLMPPDSVVKSFIDNYMEYDDISQESLIYGNEYNITWRTLFNFYIKNPKIQNLNKILDATKECFIATTINKDNAPDIFNISLIFADSDKIEVKTKAIENIKFIINKQWYGWSNYKDAQILFEFYSVDVKWFKEYLVRGLYKNE